MTAMRIICISRGTFGGGSELAEKLAAKLGCVCLSREELTIAASDAGIPVGKIEMAIVNGRPLSERLALERDRFTAFVTASLCERARETGVVYHGRTGHLALRGVDHVLRVRVVMEDEVRIELTMQRLGVDRAKARRYNEQVDEDRRKWARTLYSLDWADPTFYDVVINLSHISADNAASSLISMAQLPEFQATPATVRALEDLQLAARCRLALGDDPRTDTVAAQVRADHGRVSVTYLPRHEHEAAVLPEVLREVDGVREVVCTMASTNLVWVQERFDPSSAALPHLLGVASRWNASVELLQLVSEEQAPAEHPPISGEADETISLVGGAAIDDETKDPPLQETMQRLIAAGCAGGHRVVRGGGRELLRMLEGGRPNSLVVIGDVFLAKASSVRKRLSRDLVATLSDRLHTPVVGAEELSVRYSFGAKQWRQLFVSGVLVAAMYMLVFSHQEQIVRFMSQEGTATRVLSSAAVFLSVPVFAFLLGGFTQTLLKLVKFE